MDLPSIIFAGEWGGGREGLVCSFWNEQSWQVSKPIIRSPPITKLGRGRHLDKFLIAPKCRSSAAGIALPLLPLLLYTPIKCGLHLVTSQIVHFPHSFNVQEQNGWEGQTGLDKGNVCYYFDKWKRVQGKLRAHVRSWKATSPFRKWNSWLDSHHLGCSVGPQEVMTCTSFLIRNGVYKPSLCV